jgi:hypothetical protein
MEQRSCRKANSHSASQGIHHLLRNPKVHYRVHNLRATGPYREPDESSPHHHNLFIYDTL